MAATLVYSTSTVELWVDWADGSGYAYCWPDPAIAAYSTSDCHIYGNNASYSTARSTSSTYATGTYFILGQNYAPSIYTVWRDVMPFDTTFLGAGTTVTSATLSITPRWDYSNTDFNILLRKITPSLPYQTTYREATYDAILAASDILTVANTSTIVADTTITTADIGAANVSKTAWTYLSLISSRDSGNNQPAGAEYIHIWAEEATTAAYRPKLTVNFTGLTGVGTVYVAQAAVEVPYTYTSPAIRVAQAAVEVPYTATTVANVQVAQAAVEVPQKMDIPVITEINPYIGTIGDSVTVTGTRFHTTQGAGTVKFGGVTATVSSWSDTSITCTVPQCAAGNVNVVVTNAYGYASAAVTFRNASGTTTVYSDLSGGWWTFGSGTYSDSDLTSTSVGNGNYGAHAANNYTTGFLYNRVRGGFRFPTSFLGSAATVTQANLTLTCTTDASSTDFDVLIIKASGWTAINATMFDSVPGGTQDDNIWRNTSGMSTNTPYTSGNLDTTWVSKTGYTYYTTQSSRDRSDTTPTLNVNERIILANYNDGTVSYRPQLTLSYTDSGPVITGIDPNPAGPGTEITITGTGFGASQGDGYVTFTGYGNQATVTSWSATSIVLDVPEGTLSGNISVTDDGGLRSAGYYLQCEVPIGITDSLTLTDTLSVTASTSLTDDLTLTDSIGDISGDLSPDDTLGLTEEIDIEVALDRADTLTLTDTLLIEVTPESQTDSLELTDVLDIVRYIMIADDLTLDATTYEEGTLTMEQEFTGQIGYVWGTNNNYSQAHANAVDFDFPADVSWVGQDKVGGTTYWVWRTLLKFDTSGLLSLLLSGWTIDSAEISMYLGSYDSTVPFTVNIGSAWWVTYDPPSAENQTDLFNVAINSGSDAPWLDITGEFMTLQYYDSQPLDTMYINPAGDTYYSVVSVEDLIGSPPNSYEAISIENLDGETPPILRISLSKSGGVVEGDDGIDITAYIPVSEDLTLEETVHEDVSFGLTDTLDLTDEDAVTAYISQTDDLALTDAVEQRREKKLGAKTMRSYTLGRHAGTMVKRGRFGNSGGPK